MKKNLELVEDYAKAENRIVELEAALKKQKRMFELQKYAIDKWCPCSDHRDKTPPNYCSVCEIEKIISDYKKIGLELAADYLENIDTYVYSITMEKFAKDIRKL